VADYRAVFGVAGARYPASGERLVACRRPGLELVVSPHKSIAELGVIGRAEDMHRIVDAELDATLAYRRCPHRLPSPRSAGAPQGQRQPRTHHPKPDSPTPRMHLNPNRKGPQAGRPPAAAPSYSNPSPLATAHSAIVIVWRRETQKNPFCGSSIS
jgi:hypothetical protein